MIHALKRIKIMECYYAQNVASMSKLWMSLESKEVKSMEKEDTQPSPDRLKQMTRDMRRKWQR